jgi:alkylated DNA repair dioxygenase AlkB
MKKHREASLFDISNDAPEGFVYRPEFISREEERELLRHIQVLEFHSFRWHGFIARRRIVDYGWSYSFDTLKLTPGKPIPEFLKPVRSRAADFAGVKAEDLSEALITEYQPGAAIDWHRDVPHFNDVIGLSLLAPCTFRMRRAQAKTWERFNITAEPRSIYLMRGPARTEWQHSIPAAERLRYSITFRTKRG